MNIIDSHVHVHPIPGSFWDSPPERILKLFDEAGINQGIIMPYSEISPGDSYSESLIEYLCSSIERYPDRLYGYLRLQPKEGSETTLFFDKLMQNHPFYGLKLHPVGSRVHPGDEATIELIEAASRWQAPILFHCGDEELTLPYQIATAARACPKASIILGHMGGYFHVWDAIQVALEFPNIYLETSAMPYPSMIKEAVSRIGSKRVLFASDGPGCDPLLERKKVERADLSYEDMANIFYNNITNILGSVKKRKESLK